eukprot:s2423_g26.t1
MEHPEFNSDIAPTDVAAQCHTSNISDLKRALGKCWPAFGSSPQTSPALSRRSRSSLDDQGTFAGNTVEISLVDSSVVLKGLPGPRPNDAMLPVTAPGLHADRDLSQSRLWVTFDPCLKPNETTDVNPPCSGRTL